MTRALAALLALAVVVPQAAAQDAIRDTVVRFPSGDLTLEGTLTLPLGAGPWPAAVIVAGSGPTDRNGNSAMGLATDVYALLARGLAEGGIASLRYDKRGLPSSTGRFDMATTTIGDFAGDAAAATRFLAARADLGPIVLLGHSEGGTLAMLAARDGAPVAGLVLVATAGRDASTVLREQLGRQLPPDRLAQFDTAWAAYLRSDTTVTPPTGLYALFVPANRRFMQSWQAIDPVVLLRGIRLPTLVLQGETDVQITPADARALGSARPDVGVVVFPGVNHVLKLATGATAMAQMSTYTDKSIPLAPGVVEAVVGFVKELDR